MIATFRLIFISVCLVSLGTAALADGISKADLDRILREERPYKVLGISPHEDPDDAIFKILRALSDESNAEAIAQNSEFSAKLAAAKAKISSIMEDIVKNDQFKRNGENRAAKPSGRRNAFQDASGENTGEVSHEESEDSGLERRMEDQVPEGPIISENQADRINETLNKLRRKGPQFNPRDIHYDEFSRGDRIVSNDALFEDFVQRILKSPKDAPIKPTDDLNKLLSMSVSARTNYFHTMSVLDFENLGIVLLRSTPDGQRADLTAALYIFLEEFTRPLGSNKDGMKFTIVGSWASQVGRVGGIETREQMLSLLDFLVEAPLPKQSVLIGIFQWSLQKTVDHTADKALAVNTEEHHASENAKKLIKIFESKHPFFARLFNAIVFHMPIRYQARKLNCKSAVENLDPGLH